MSVKVARNERRTVRWTVPTLVVFAVVAGMMLLTSAHARPTIDITITNNSQTPIRHVYLAPGNPDDWGPNQLGGGGLAPGASVTINSVSCQGSSIRVIAEDENGCFIYHNVTCSGNASWTITNSESPDCGNN